MRLLLSLPLILGLSGAVLAAEPLDFDQLAQIRSVGSAAISPDGGTIAYTLAIPRDLTSEDDGGQWTELRVVDAAGGTPRPYVQGKVNVANVRFSPDGSLITFLAKRDGDDHRSLYAIPLAGGESRRWLTFESNITDYRLSPDGKRVAFIAVPAEDKARKASKKKGFSQQVFEEDWRPRNVYIADLAPFDMRADAGEKSEPKALDVPGSVFEIEWLPAGDGLVAVLAPRPLVDDSYMAKRIHVVDATSGSVRAKIENPGKLGNVEISPDGQWIAYISAADPNDPAAGRLMVASVAGGEPTEWLPGLEGHVRQIAWHDATHLVAAVAKGTATHLWRVGSSGQTQELAASGGDSPIVGGLSVSADGQRAAIAGDTPRHPSEVFAIDLPSGAPRRLTDSNPWMTDVALAAQQVIKHRARDGVELEGILIRPLTPKQGSPAPLILIVHGGPESHINNGWVTNYSRPGQLAAGMGYAVFYPNYRGSTGRGVAFSKLGQGDAAGKEYSDLIDAVDHLVAEGIADRERVGITGGSYGGYATAWCSTFYTERFKAGVMFVGISNKLSKGFTTDIPVEDKMVHTLFDPWTKWQFSLERSPIYHAEKGRTPLLISVGKDDPRVHPSQSLQMYRSLKLIDKTPVRLVQYPGEGHGNRRAASRDDYSRRLIRWMDHFLLTDSKELPPWNLPHYEEMGSDDEADE